MGIKGNLLAGDLSLNATLYSYDYEDFQVQFFDSEKIQYTTGNASELRTNGAEIELHWLTPVDGLSVRSSLAIGSAKYTEEFINADGQDLDGEDRLRNADVTGYAGTTYERALNSNWNFSASLDARYSGDYSLASTLNPYEQDAFWLVDATIKISSGNGRYELAFIGQNLSDKIIAYSSFNRPAACVNADVTNLDPVQRCATNVLSIEQDQVVNTGLGARYTLQFRVNF